MPVLSKLTSKSELAVVVQTFCENDHAPETRRQTLILLLVATAITVPALFIDIRVEDVPKSIVVILAVE